MNRTVKIAALGTALALCVTAFASCASEDPKISESYEKVSEGSKNALGLESGEVYIIEKTALETDLEGYAVNGEIETYITYKGAEAPDFTLKSRINHPDTGELVDYELIKDGDTVLEIIDGSGDFVEADGFEFPDVFEYFRLDYEKSDIESAASAPKEKGTQLYTFTMSSSYSDKFDSESDGVEADCSAVTYACYVTHEKLLERVVVTYTYTITADGVSQNMVKTVDALIA